MRLGWGRGECEREEGGEVSFCRKGVGWMGADEVREDDWDLEGGWGWDGLVVGGTRETCAFMQREYVTIWGPVHAA